MALFKQGKSSKIFWGIGLFFVALFILAEGWIYYDKWQGEERVRKLAQALEEIQKEVFDRKAADKIGGKTPLETMNLYINAVENGNYELASQYFIIEKQKEELDILKNSPAKNIKNIINLMKQTSDEFIRFSNDEKSFSVHSPILVSFVLYPSGNWKIEEI